MMKAVWIIDGLVFLAGLVVWGVFYYIQKQVDGAGPAGDGDVGLVAIQIVGIVIMAITALIAAGLGVARAIFGAARLFL